MNQKIILEPLGDVNATNLLFLKNKAKEIFSYLKNLDLGIEIEFHEFITNFK